MTDKQLLVSTSVHLLFCTEHTAYQKRTMVFQITQLASAERVRSKIVKVDNYFNMKSKNPTQYMFLKCIWFSNESM